MYIDMAFVDAFREPALAPRPQRIAAIFQFPRAAIPQHHRSTAIFSLRNHAFEFAVLDRMIFDFDREPLLRGIE